MDIESRAQLEQLWKIEWKLEVCEGYVVTAQELHGQLPLFRNQCFDVTLAGLSNSFSGSPSHIPLYNDQPKTSIKCILSFYRGSFYRGIFVLGVQQVIL